jgi:hypothetical protein
MKTLFILIDAVLQTNQNYLGILDSIFYFLVLAKIQLFSFNNLSVFHIYLRMDVGENKKDEVMTKRI